MKSYLNTIKLALFLPLATIILSSCGGEAGEPTIDILADKAALLVKGLATTTDTKVNEPDGVTNQDWDGFTITFTGTKAGGTYTTNATGNQAAVWPASGSWVFTDETGTKITRDNKEVVNLAVNATDLTLTFTVADPATRTKVVKGQWVFEFKF